MVARIHWMSVANLVLVLVVLYLLLRDGGFPGQQYKAENLAQIVLYNRIPKTGSTTFTNAVAYDLAKKNGFNVIHLNITGNRFAMSLPDQSSFARNISLWTARQPAFYHGHVSYIDFTRFGYPNPVYINIVREPLERLISYYYFLQHGDDYRVGLKRSRAGKNETFEECFRRQGRDCDPSHMWLQIPYFCGTMSFCGEPGNEEALKTAKWNMRHRYLLVGLTERIEDMVKLLEYLLPGFFHGALEHFQTLNERRSHLRHTLNKSQPSERVLDEMRKNRIYRMEREFYDAVVEEFEGTMKRAITTNGELSMNNFHYEKIKP